jgi:uncharacterized protein with NAD-binding domain and iron-sulfur cluster
MPDGKGRIAIVGAGPAGLSAAFHLTSPLHNPGWEERYEVDVYQLGWRVGGKGATGRNPDAGERIQEHGIHVFGNMYFNSFRMLDECYDQVAWDEHDRFRSLPEAFLPSLFVWESEYWDGRWHGRATNFPDNEKLPWEGSIWPDERDIVQEVLNVCARRLGDVLIDRDHRHRGLWGWIIGWFERHLGDVLVKQYEEVIERLDWERSHPNSPPVDADEGLLGLLDGALDTIGLWFLAGSQNVDRRVAYIDADLAVTTLKGVIDDQLVRRGIDSIDGENYRDWLARHGASETTLKAGSPQALPNTALSYARGDTTQIPTMSAAAFVTFFLRQLSGKGAGAYFFTEGTGETVMKPLFRLLQQRGVRFHFFHKLASVLPADGEDAIDSLTFDVQATVVAGASSYEPLRRMADGELVWPDRPLYDQLAEGEALKATHELECGGYDLESWWTAWKPVGSLTLRRGEDFDEVVLATPISTLPHTCPAVIDHPAGAAWGPMVDNVQSAATQSVQLWLTECTPDLGWAKPPAKTDRWVGATYNQDLTSFCDFSDLIGQERWPADNTPQGLIYLIGALSDPVEIPGFDDHDFPIRERERVKWATIQWLRNVDGLLPLSCRNPVDARSFDFALLHQLDPTKPTFGVNTFDNQYWKVNIDPNERYTLTVAGTVQYRLQAWESGFANLVLAGDWIYTGFNVGSFEGAVMSGKLASLTLTGAPTIDQVYGYDFLHPELSGKGPPPAFLNG